MPKVPNGVGTMSGKKKSSWPSSIGESSRWRTLPRFDVVHKEDTLDQQSKLEGILSSFYHEHTLDLTVWNPLYFYSCPMLA